MRLIDGNAIEKFIVDGLNAPTIDHEELRLKGRWERVIPTKSAAKWSTKVSCSNCHKQGYTHHNYCPNCGAKMEGVTDGKT